MSDFIIEDTDYIDFIKNEDDMKLFNRLKETYPKIKGVQFKDCVDDVIEFIKTEDMLMKNPVRKIIKMGNPNNN